MDTLEAERRRALASRAALAARHAAGTVPADIDELEELRPAPRRPQELEDEIDDPRAPSIPWVLLASAQAILIVDQDQARFIVPADTRDHGEPAGGPD